MELRGFWGAHRLKLTAFWLTGEVVRVRVVSRRLHWFMCVPHSWLARRGECSLKPTQDRVKLTSLALIQEAFCSRKDSFKLRPAKGTTFNAARPLGMSSNFRSSDQAWRHCQASCQGQEPHQRQNRSFIEVRKPLGTPVEAMINKLARMKYAMCVWTIFHHEESLACLSLGNPQSSGDVRRETPSLASAQRLLRRFHPTCQQSRG